MNVFLLEFTDLALPDVDRVRSHEAEAVARVERRGLFGDLHCARVELAGALDVEERDAVRVVAVLVAAVLEARGLAAVVHNHLALEQRQEVVRLCAESEEENAWVKHLQTMACSLADAEKEPRRGNKI